MAKKAKKKVTGRREAIKTMAIVAGAVAAEPLIEGKLQAQHAHHAAQQAASTAAQAAAPYKPLYFNEHQLKTVATVAELIIPRTETPGAMDAKVHEYIDLIVSEDRNLQPVYERGLAWLDRRANEAFGANFVDCKPEQQTAILTFISSPNNRSLEDMVGVEFFRTIKNMTIDGYYTSEVGIHKELQYKGNDYLTEFPGCQHPEHLQGSK